MDLSDVVYADTECVLCSVTTRMRIYVIFGSGLDEYELGHRFEGPTLNQVLIGSTTCRQCGADLLADIDIVDSVITRVTTRPAPPRYEFEEPWLPS